MEMAGARMTDGSNKQLVNKLQAEVDQYVLTEKKGLFRDREPFFIFWGTTARLLYRGADQRKVNKKEDAEPFSVECSLALKLTRNINNVHVE